MAQVSNLCHIPVCLISRLSRRNFLSQFSAAALTGFAPQTQRLERIGLGLFTIPWLLEKDFAGTLKLLAQIGYKELEFYGPYPFSTPAAHERWKSVTAAVGFKGSGYFGLTGKQVRPLMNRHGLTSPSMHTDLGTLRARLNQLAEAAQVMGQRYVTLPAIPDAERPNLDAYKRLADEFNQIGANAAKAGVMFMYHNHGYGLVEKEGQIPFRALVERTDPKLVALEMDIYWTTAGGADPIAYLKEFPGRFHALHIKDAAKPIRFAGDGGDSKQRIELFPFISDAGSGVLDLPGILSAAQHAGAKHFFVERDRAPKAEDTLRNSYRYLAALRLK